MRDGVQQQMSKFRDELNAVIEEHIQDPDAHFSPEEREDLRKRLQEIEERIAASQLTKDEIDRVRQLTRDMGKGVETMTKRSWVRTLVSNAAAGGMCRFVIRLASGTRIHVDAPGQLGPFDDERIQFTDARGHWMWIAYRAIAAVESKDKPLIPPERF